MIRLKYQNGMSELMIETYEQALAFIHGRHKWTKTPTFDRLGFILATLNHPEHKQKYIHVTGTNGKGSTSQMMASILRAANLQVGLFSSPFIERFNERIQDNNGPISDVQLLTLVQRLEPLVCAQDVAHPGFELTEFEIVTVLMFMYFEQMPVDVVILEVGIGGMWDSTQIIADKLAAVITSVSYDHMHVLGNTLTEITQQKADIIAPGKPVIVGDLPQEALTVVQDIAQKRDSDLYVDGQSFGMRTVDHQLTYVIDQHKLPVQLNLNGQYQIGNAAVAIKTVQIVAPMLGVTIADASIQEGLRHVIWPARFETVADHPLVIVDGAHNVAGIDALVQTLRSSYSDKTVGIVFSALADKHFEQMLRHLLAETNLKIVVVPFTAPGSRQAIAGLPFTHPRLTWGDDWQTALKSLQAQTDMMVITGSLYFVSEVRQQFK